MRLLEEKLLRFIAPGFYSKMVDTFSAYHIHPYDVHATAIKREDGLEVSLTFSSDFSQSVTKHFTNEQAIHPDEEVIQFFQEAADQCKSILIANYYKMMKQ